MLTKKLTIRNISGISKTDEAKIICFLQGAIYCWCKNRAEEWFAVRDLLGGANFHWQGIPLIVLYEKHINKGKSNTRSIEDAGKDAGWLLLKTIKSDIRLFDTKREALTRKYLWLPNNTTNSLAGKTA